MRRGQTDSSIRDYVRMAWHNKATLSGLLATTAGLTGLAQHGIHLDSESAALALLGAAGLKLLSKTDFGLSTLIAYQQTRYHLREHGRLDSLFAARTAQAEYCIRAGVEAAVREHEHART